MKSRKWYVFFTLMLILMLTVSGPNTVKAYEELTGYVDEAGILHLSDDGEGGWDLFVTDSSGHKFESDLHGGLTFDLFAEMAKHDLPSGSYTVYVTTYWEDWESLGHGAEKDWCRADFTYVAVDEITLNRTSLSLYAGKTANLVATVIPSNAVQKVTWTSSDISIATVDENGKVSTKAPGTVKITASAGGKSAVCTIKLSLNRPVLKAIYNSAKGADIRFQAVTGADSYVIMRKLNGVWSEVCTVNAGTLEKENGAYKYIDTAVASNYGQGYIYSVAAKRGSTVGNYDKTGLPLYRLKQPTITSVKSTEAGTVVVTWTKENCQGYEVQYSSDNGKTWTKATQVKGGSVVQQTITGLSMKKTYVFRIRCQKTNADRGTTWSQYSPWKSGPWKGSTFTVTFDSDGGTPCSPITLNDGDPLPALPVPFKEGYAFLGWYDKNGTWIGEGANLVCKDITLYAHYAKGQG